MVILQYINLALRFLLELCALVALGYWGVHMGKGTSMKIALGISAPLLTAVVWGTFGSPNAAVKLSAPLHSFVELMVFGVPAVALYVSGKQQLAWIYVFLFVFNRILMIVWRQ